MDDEPLPDLSRGDDPAPGETRPDSHTAPHAASRIPPAGSAPFTPPSPVGATPGFDAERSGVARRSPRAAVQAPERSEVPGSEDGAADEEGLETPATRLVERLGEARTAVVSALGSAGERVRQAVPQSERALDAGRTLGGNAARGIQPLTAWLARVFHPLWDVVHTKIFHSRRRTGVLATLIVIVVLLAAIMPPLLTLSNALKDYRELSTLGNDGLHHLLAAKDDLAGLSSNLSEFDNLNGLLSSTPAAVSAPYEYEMQRQAGTDYPISVTVHPAPSMAKAGLGDKQYNTTLDQSTTFDYGSPPAVPTPTPTATPSPTPSTGKPSGSAPSSSGSTSSSSTTVNIEGAITELRAANADFVQLRNKLNNPDWILNAVGTLPGTKTKVSTVKALADVGYDATTMALEFVNALSPVLQRVEGGPLSSQGDLVTPAELAALQHAMVDANAYLDDIESRLQVIDISTLPISAQQAATFTEAVKQIPRVKSLLNQAAPWLPAVGWALGVGGSRHFLVQTLDKAELRATGGFTGNYGVLTITNGKLDPFELYNINDIEYGYKNNGYIYGRKAPDQFSWWPFPDFGLRDSNLSADFPTTAKLNMDLFKAAGQGDTDGVIQFTTTVIAHVLRVTGPIYVPNFNETVTADNLEDKIHFYEEDPRGIAIQQKLFPDDHTFSLRKRFTQAVTQLLQDKVKHLPSSEFVPLAKQVFEDMKSKDLQVYVTNTQIEDQLLKMSAGGAIDTKPDVDGYLMVQSNTSVNKGTPYVQITQHDDVTLDDSGGASHRLTMTFYNNPTGPIYGYSTYRDYVRIYTPPQSRLTRATGFDTGLPLCWAPPSYAPTATKPDKFATVPDCQGNPYPDGELSCPSGSYGPGPIAYTYFSDGYTNWVLDVLGPPTQTSTDLAGRQMWGGYVVVPANCTATVTMRWFVPHIARVGS